MTIDIVSIVLIVQIVPMESTAHTIVKNAWIIYTIRVMRQKELRKENMIVLIWPIFIPVNMLADIPQR